MIDSITSSYAAEGQAVPNPAMVPPGAFPPPFGFPGKLYITIFNSKLDRTQSSYKIGQPGQLPPPPFGMPPPGGPGAPPGMPPRTCPSL